MFGGSFQSLLREASVGVLYVADDAFYSEHFSSHGFNNNDNFSREIVENDVFAMCGQGDESICAEGYNGGTEADVAYHATVEGNVELLDTELQVADKEGDVQVLDKDDYALKDAEFDGIWGINGGSSPANEDVSDSDDDAIKDGEFDGLWGINGDSSPGIADISDSDDEFLENAKEAEQCIPTTALGDCGCVTGSIEVDVVSTVDKDTPNDQEGDEDEDEDKDEDEDEDGDIVVMDMEQEIYIDPDQNAPYKKRFVHIWINCFTVWRTHILFHLCQ